MFKIIRIGTAYQLVLVVFERPGFDNEYYRLSTWFIGNQEPYQFHQIDENEAQGYSGGHGDGLGYEKCPKRKFRTLEEVAVYIRKNKNV